MNTKNSIKKIQHMNIDGIKMIPSCNLKENPRISFVIFQSPQSELKFVSVKVPY
jgi:hypothetical protein